MEYEFRDAQGGVCTIAKRHLKEEVIKVGNYFLPMRLTKPQALVMARILFFFAETGEIEEPNLELC